MDLSDTSGDLVLENINSGEKFLLDQNVKVYRCGRRRDNDIVTNSVLASREHCIFVRVGPQLNVIDKDSSNGIYVNGTIQPLKLVPLHINDIIGLGTLNTVPDSPRTKLSPTIFVLKRFEPEPPPSSPPSPPPQLEVPDPSLITEHHEEEKSNTTTENKRRLSKDSIEPNVPCKIAKIDEDKSFPVGRENTDKGASPSNPSASPLLDIIDITDLNSSDDELPIANKPDGAVAFKQPATVVRNSSKNSVTENMVTSSSDDLSQPLIMDTDQPNNSEDDSSTENQPSIKKEENLSHLLINKNAIPSNLTIEQDNKVNSSITIEATTSKKDNTRPSAKEKREISNDPSIFKENEKKNSEFLVVPFDCDKFASYEEMADKNGREFKGDGISETTLVQTNNNGVDQLIKYEPDITIVDDDESVYTSLKHSPIVPVRTPLKLKHVKEEKRTTYSEIDVVILSDDEEDGDIFPASQLFGDPVEDGVKEKSFINSEEEIEDDMFADDRAEDPDTIFIDSDIEDDLLYNRVMQSSLNKSRDFYMKEELFEEENEGFNDVNNTRKEIYDICFNHNQDESDESSIEERLPAKKKRSNSMEILESTRLELHKQLKDLEKSETSLQKLNLREEVAEEVSKKQKSLGDQVKISKISNESAEMKISRDDQKKNQEKDNEDRELTKKKKTDEQYRSKDKNKVNETVANKESGKKTKTKKSTFVDDKSTRISDTVGQNLVAEGDKSAGAIDEKPRKISREDSPSEIAGNSESRSMKNLQSRSKEKSRSMDEPETTNKPRKISTDRSPISKRDSLSPTMEYPSAASSKNDRTRRSVPLVDAPFLAKGERRGVSSRIKRLGSSFEQEEATTSGVCQSSDINDHVLSTSREEPVVPAEKQASNGFSPKLTTRQKRELAIKEKQEKYLKMKEQKVRRQKNKWAECLPPRAHQGSTLTRQEREDLKNDRKEKLKKIAEEKKKAMENNENSETRRFVKKGIAKVTEKTRGDFLVNDVQDQVAKQSADLERTSFNTIESSEPLDNKHCDKSADSIKENLTKRSDMSKLNGAKSSEDEKCKDKSSDVMYNNETNGETSMKGDQSSKVMVESRNPVNEPTGHDSHLRKTIEKIASKSTSKRSEAIAPIEAKALSETELLSNKFLASVNLKPSKKTKDPRDKSVTSGKKRSTSATTKSRNEKRVRFNDLMTEIRTFEIEPGNTLNKCPSTDAPILERRVRKRTLDRGACPKLEQFLLRIFSWNPSWLQEQKHFNIPPPIVDEHTLLPIISKFTSYGDYYKITEPLLALELWSQISKDQDTRESKNLVRPQIMCSVVNNSISLTTVHSTKFRVTKMMLEVVISRRDLSLENHPNYGDLICFQYCVMSETKKKFFNVFAYVESMSTAVITSGTHYNRDLLHYVKEPYAVLTYSVVTKPIDPKHIQMNRVYRLNKVSYLRSNMRMIQALQYLPVSPLIKHILHPDFEDFKLPEMPVSRPKNLITKDNLNARQLEAVVRVTDAVVRKLPKICLIQGPPGTGKSKVIVNLVTEILYGEGRYSNNKKMRILVCAPSNAAIDEIALRLLDVRKTIPGPENRFKMVRIGKLERMHPTVKSISLQALAKKDVKMSTENYLSPAFTIDSVNEEKRLLTAKINAKEQELLSAQKRNAPNVSYLSKTLAECRSRLDLLNNRRPFERIDPKELAKLEKGAETTYLMNADVITCTLKSCYTNMMESSFGDSGQEISVCIVDEATQCAEAETLIPLMLGVRTLVLVGDTNQLPATIISRKAKQLGLDQSLFARIQSCFPKKDKSPVIHLNTQYRMSWPVAFWPNKFFYDGLLHNSANLESLPFHFYKVLNLDAIQNEEVFSNTQEATFIAKVLYTLMARSRLDHTKRPVRVGIITPYNKQKTMIPTEIEKCIKPLPESTKSKLVYDVNTVDGFQGQERDVIVMSCVRSSGIGFLSDRQRLCVALTRAKHSLILCGNFKTFEKDSMWNALLSDAKSRGCYTKIKATASPDEIKPHICR
ncbi:probable helicase senataxin [Venturia canescens]|uniref:probable helicase senataxin n=1 Tax=Venturia canescens TaxID=32260 RepID=UPI001C9C4425|nr:probable helicase senataxin [Venturia canescens]